MMHPVRRRKLIIILCCLCVAALGVSFILFALRENINLFVTPTQVVEGEVPPGRIIRIGGLVVDHSLKRGGGTKVSFIVTDTHKRVTVDYDGILPDLFQEGQAVVVTGMLDNAGNMRATEVLAKHDENYMPAEAAEAILQAQKMMGNQ